MDGLFVYQIAVSIVALLGSVIALALIRPITLWKWRKVGYRFAAALTLYALVELMALTSIFWDPPIIQVIAKALVVLYIVYGVFEFRMIVEEELS